MKKSNPREWIFRIILYSTAIFVLASAPLRRDILLSKDADIVFMVTLISSVIMSTMEINAGKGYIEFTDALAGFLFIKFGLSSAVIFDTLSAVIVGVISAKFLMHQKSKSKIAFNASMFAITTYSSATLTELIFKYLPGDDLIQTIAKSTMFIGLFLIINIGIIKIDYIISTGKKFVLYREGRELILTNFIVSSMLTTTLCLIYKESGVIGAILVIGNLIILHYCFYIYRKLQIRNEAVNGLLRITNDIVKYGDFRDKCKHLIISLKELIPYDICAVYTFDLENDSVAYPIAYNGLEDLGIGELSLDLSSRGITVKTIKEGRIYISRDITKDKKIKVTGKLADVVEAMVFVPILIEEKVSGLILIGGNNDLSAFVNNGINDILNILSNQMALAIENDSFYRSIKNHADRDSLTKLFNRRVFDRELKGLIDAGTQFSLVMYDIDDFKKINDGYGHLTGDKVLTAISDVITKSIRKTDVACRYGGEEIAILFKDLSKEDAYIISERIREKIEDTRVLSNNNNISVTISGGVASFPDDGHTKEDIIDRADGVLYSECKNKGKNKVCAYNMVAKNSFSGGNVQSF